MNYADKLIEAAQSTKTVPEQIFRTRYGKRPDLKYCFVEGNEDIIFYKDILGQCHAAFAAESIGFVKCNNKDILLFTKSRLTTTTAYRQSVIFLVDRDFDDIIGVDHRSSDCWTTDHYSIESYFIDPESLRRFWLHGLGLDLDDDRLEDFTSSVATSLKSIWSLTENLHSDVAYLQREGAPLKFSDLNVERHIRLQDDYSYKWSDDVGDTSHSGLRKKFLRDHHERLKDGEDTVATISAQMSENWSHFIQGHLALNTCARAIKKWIGYNNAHAGDLEKIRYPDNLNAEALMRVVAPRLEPLMSLRETLNLCLREGE